MTKIEAFITSMNECFWQMKVWKRAFFTSIKTPLTRVIISYLVMNFFSGIKVDK